MMASFPPPPPSLAAASITSSASSSSSFYPSLLIIAALLAFVLVASVSIHLLLGFLSRPSPSPAAPPPLPHDFPASEVVASTVVWKGEDEKERLIESLPLFTMASALAALPKSSPDCAVCLSPFSPVAELRLLPACRHAFHAACVDAWLRTTPSCPLCRAAVTLPHPVLPAGPAQEPPPESRSSRHSRSFVVEIGSISNRRSSAAGDNADRRTYSLGSFDYQIDEEIEAVVSRITRAGAIKEAKPAVQEAPSPPGDAVAEAAGSRGGLREYVDRLASSASSFSGRWSSRWSQSHHTHIQEEFWWWDAEAAAIPAPDVDEDEVGFMALYRWIMDV